MKVVADYLFRVVCVDNKDFQLSLSVGKWYEVFYVRKQTTYYRVNKHFYTIITDRGHKKEVCASYFMTLDELREKKLEELGI